jgi:hypothetical protein
LPGKSRDPVKKHVGLQSTGFLLSAQIKHIQFLTPCFHFLLEPLEQHLQPQKKSVVFVFFSQESHLNTALAEQAKNFQAQLQPAKLPLDVSNLTY